MDKEKDMWNFIHKPLFLHFAAFFKSFYSSKKDVFKCTGLLIPVFLDPRDKTAQINPLL